MGAIRVAPFLKFIGNKEKRMKKKRWLALLLCLIMAISSSIITLAEERTLDASTWMPEDFTYTNYSKLLYGCDYTREFTVEGIAISGFSESGEAKLDKNTDLVIPSVDDKGNTIVGIADSAFKNKGLTSVEFPTGMMIDYDDTVTHVVTKRGNFVIGDSAFANNNLTSVDLPEGVIACLTYAFNNNKIERVELPKTIWWIETMAFAQNRIETVEFPTTCDFQLEMHGLAFAKNFIQSVRLPDYTFVVNKEVFSWNLGMESIPEDAKADYKTYTVDGITYKTGLVYMYTDNAELATKDRIHHVEKATSSQKSYFQKLVVNDGTGGTESENTSWNINDFIVEGTVVMGLSESGIAKRAVNKNLVIPETNSEGEYITEIASAQPGGYGLFATEEEGFDSVYLPDGLKVVGDYAFQSNGLKEITFPAGLTTIGAVAFQNNKITSVVLPNTVTSLGEGAFATNPKLERISLSRALKVIPDGAFGCSDKENRMTNLTSIKLHEGITEIGSRAFAGNNFTEIVLPSTVKTIGEYAFSTKNYLTTPCTVQLNDGLETIEKYAFRNKCISQIEIPSTVNVIGENVFLKQYSDDTAVIQTKVLIADKEQFEKLALTTNEYQKPYLTDVNIWTADDFTYEMGVITGFSESGELKIEKNTEVIIPAADPEGNAVQGVGKDAFKNKGITSVSLPEGILFVDAYAFSENELTIVRIPQTMMQIAEGAFCKNNITTVDFPSVTDYALQVEMQAFSTNQIKAVQLPSNVEKIEGSAFLDNPGMTDGVVDMYIDADEPGESVEYKSAGTSDTQELILGTIPAELAPWGTGDFTYDESGTTITGLSDVGKKKIMDNPVLVIPDTGIIGAEITALGDGKTNKGIFVVVTDEETEIIDDDKYYAPSKVLLPDTLEKIGNFTFALDADITYEEEMTSISFPQGLKEIGQAAFQNSKLITLSIPDSVTEMGQGTFTGSEDLVKVKFSKNVKHIPASAFASGQAANMKLSEIVIPEGVETIGRMAFDTTKIERLELPDTLVEIGEKAFNNHQLTELVIPSGVKIIGKNAFTISNPELEKTLVNVTLNEGLETIGQYAFVGNAITEIDLPSTVVLSAQNKAADYIFGKKNAAPDTIVKVKVSDKVKAAPAGTEGSYNTELANTWSHVVVYDKLVGTGWTSKDFTYDEETGTLTGWSESGQEKRKTLKALVLPDKTAGGKDITAIGDQAFMIPNDEVIVTKFGVDSPDGMTSVVLPEYVTEIGVQAFAQNALTEVELTNITAIGERAFYGNDLVKAIIPDTVTSMGAGAFATNDITEIRLSKNVEVIPQGAFSMNIRLEQIEIPDTVTEIGATAFAGARLTSLTIPKSVVKIGVKAFHLHHLSELVIPGNVKVIGESAFEGTFKATTLKKLTIEEGVESIGKYAFKEALLETVHFPDSIKSVGMKPFLNNSGKDGSHVVEVTTYNKDHRALTDETYVIKFIGKLDESDFVKVDTIFEDVHKTDWFYEYAEYVYNYELMTGMSEKIFGPAENLSRAQFAVILYRMNGSPKTEYKAIFPDVIQGTWYTDAVIWANELGVIKGYEEGHFGPADNITREQMAVMMYRYADAKGYDVSKKMELTTFKDGASVSSFAREAMQWAVGNAIITGKEAGVRIDPQGNASRAECATIITRFMKTYE